MPINHQQKVEEEIEERTAPPGDVVYQAIHQEGEDELKRRSMALAWSGLAAGLSMGFSLVAEGLLHEHLPQTNWSPLIVKTGYAMGFLVVILGRQQLFTKDTLTAILPLLRRKELPVFLNVLRLWVIVFITNMLGALLFALLIAHSSMFDAATKSAFSEVSSESIKGGFGTMLLRAIFAGWLIALMAWMLPFAESARIWVIIFLAYVVGVGGFPHVVAGAVKTFYLATTGDISFGKCLGGFVAPALIGNIIGGTALVAVLAHVQFMAHKEEEKKR